MKPLRLARGIVPLGEFKARAAAYLRDLKEESGPLVLTQNGRPAAVIIAPQEYDRLREEQEYLQAVASGLADAVSGQVVDHSRVAEWLASWGTDEEREPPL
jgi:prevent-host-death family protein